jgi:6-phosphogluconate dehydrogenase
MEGKYVLGMIGLGTMGQNLLLNMADHDFVVAGHDKDPAKIDALESAAGTSGRSNVKGFLNLQEFIDNLKLPRAVMLLVPAGKIVDQVIADLVPILAPGDLIIDGGNSHFTDTNRRVEELKGKGLHFFGMGVSGGEEGARHGPSMMPGGDRKAYAVVEPVLKAVAAKVDGDPCVTYIGPGSAGHFVKMVHNGIEYAIMQMIAESYGFMKQALMMPDQEIHAAFNSWNEGRLQSFLIEITRDILAYREPGRDHLLLNDIKDEARSKGTGKWTSQVAMDLQTALTAIDTAVSMRDLSKYKKMRSKAATLYSSPVAVLVPDENYVEALEEALYFSTIVAYAQGIHLLAQASAAYGYELAYDRIALIWRGGCIIRSVFLQDIYKAFKSDPALPHLLLDDHISKKVSSLLDGTRRILSKAITAGVAMPAQTAALTYFDSFRSDRMPTNLIQAQRDYFGAHTYERIDKDGVFHTQWQE